MQQHSSTAEETITNSSLRRYPAVFFLERKEESSASFHVSSRWDGKGTRSLSCGNRFNKKTKMTTANSTVVFHLSMEFTGSFRFYDTVPR